MCDVEIYERRAREAEELARLVTRAQNRRRYLAMAGALRALVAAAREAEAQPEVRAA